MHRLGRNFSIFKSHFSPLVNQTRFARMDRQNKRVRIADAKDKLGKNARKKMERERILIKYNSAPLPAYISEANPADLFSWD